MHTGKPGGTSSAEASIKKKLRVKLTVPRYVCWSPVPCKIELTRAQGVTEPVELVLKSDPIPKNKEPAGSVDFYAARSDTPSPLLTLKLRLNTEVEFFISGRFRSPSSNDKDAGVTASAVDFPATILATARLMVRIRKNAERLTANERRIFLRALARFKRGRYTDFQKMHDGQADHEAHGGPAFLAWHRGYLLDLERELQALDKRVALPYWQFTEAAPSLFAPNFFGAPGERLASNNPIRKWRIFRFPEYDPKTEGARADIPGSGPTSVMAEANTLSTWTSFNGFRLMQRDPHNPVHTFTGGLAGAGDLSDPATAPLDPLFFLLHANVDRLWAMWQSRKKSTRYDKSSAESSSAPNLLPPFFDQLEDGHRLSDTLWPWNQKDTVSGSKDRPRPKGFKKSTLAPAPPTAPTVAEMIDYGGVHAAENYMGYDYDDVPFGR